MKNPVKTYVIWAYLLFWTMVMGLCGTASMVFHCSPVIMRALSNVCAWSPTIVLFAGFSKFLPDTTVKAFFKKMFGGKINFVLLIVLVGCICGATLVSVYFTSLFQHKDFASYWSLGSYSFLASFLFSLTSGPTGEECGWRGFLRLKLSERYSFIKASIIQGVIWAFWHTILWFVDSDFMGLQMIPYIISNVIVMTGLATIMNLVLEKHENLIYAIVIHFCFNFLYCFLQVDILFYVILSIVYLIIFLGICFTKKD